MTTLILAAVATVIIAIPCQSLAADAAAIERDSKAALQRLYETTPVAKTLGEKAKAVLVFPSILKAGLIIGGQGGNGVLLVDGRTVGYYNIAAASFGLQAGAQEFGYTMFLMTDAARAYLDKSEGWEVGVGPSIVVVDAGVGKSLTTTTAKDDVYAFIFGQKGLMAGIGIQGSKITKIKP
ncbi:MAG: lipid-binding SYLF domain-containing protein [Desulfobulbaceae bacterium]|nr:lipid-binding SYLF domain-containing protein [Desulfobulbaceae bacterium]